MLKKIGVLHYFSKRYAAVASKWKSDILAWDQLSKAPLCLIFQATSTSTFKLQLQKFMHAKILSWVMSDKNFK